MLPEGVPIRSRTRRTYFRSMPPFGALGVPTQTNTRSEFPIAAAMSVVARKRPAATCCSPMISPISFSMTGVLPSVDEIDLPRFWIDTDHLVATLARQPAETAYVSET